MWPDECAIATEDDKDGQDDDEQEEQSARANSAVRVHGNDGDASVLDVFDKYAWLLDLLSIDHHSILPFLMEMFSSKDANVTLIYNLINVCFARLTLDCSSSSQVS